MEGYPRIPIVSLQVGQYLYMPVYLYRRIFRKKHRFVYNGREFEYFEHPYNRTWLNERAVEIPIIWDLMRKHAPADVLEIGNVTTHYFQFGHTIVDKYEKGRGTIQQDVVDLTLPRLYRLIVSISTLEHVGWDETPRTPGKHLKALEMLRKHLAPSGLLVTTLPMGHNPSLDEDLYAGKLGFDEVYYFRRMTKEVWEQVDEEKVKGSKYGIPFKAANALAIGFLHG